MAIRYYDEAVTEKIRNWTKDPNLLILKPDETTRLFEIQAHSNNDRNLKLPLIAISRDKEIEILNTQKQTKTFSGFNYVLNKDVAIPINAIPIKISYQIDIYARYMAEADEYVRNFVFNFINYPSLEITLPYQDSNIKHESNILLQSTITDNSEIKEHLFPDQFTRFTLRFIIDDAYLFSMPALTPAYLNNIDLGTNGLDIDETLILQKVEEITQIKNKTK